MGDKPLCLQGVLLELLCTPPRLAHRCGEPETGAGRNRGLEGGKFRFKEEEEERDRQRLMWPRGKPLGRKE